MARIEQCIIVHPVYPPYYAPMVEIIPHEKTSETIKNKTRDLMIQAGQKPVMLNREIDGFVLNRIQFAVNNEAYRLVDAGICSPKDLDIVLTAGLGMRYAVIGPMETSHLNSPNNGGIREQVIFMRLINGLMVN